MRAPPFRFFSTSRSISKLIAYPFRPCTFARGYLSHFSTVLAGFLVKHWASRVWFTPARSEVLSSSPCLFPVFRGVHPFTMSPGSGPLGPGLLGYGAGVIVLRHSFSWFFLSSFDMAHWELVNELVIPPPRRPVGFLSCSLRLLFTEICSPADGDSRPPPPHPLSHRERLVDFPSDRRCPSALAERDSCSGFRHFTFLSYFTISRWSNTGQAETEQYVFLLWL